MAAEVWAVGDAYERYVGRWSRLVAAEFVRWLDVPAGRRWLDVGCGTGALTATVLAVADPAEVAGVEPAEGFLAEARARIDDPRSTFHAGDARSLPYALWAPFLGGQGPAPGYAMSLPDERRDALRDLLRARLPVGPDGSIPLTARAWAVRGLL